MACQSEVMQAGNTAFAAGDYHGAITAWTQLLNFCTPRSKLVLLNRSAAYAKLGLWQLSLEDATQAWNLGLYSCKLLYRLATAQYYLQQYAACLQSCEKGLLLDPGAWQLRQLHTQTCSLLRNDFLLSRDVHLVQAVQTATCSAACQADAQQKQHAAHQQLRKKQQHSTAAHQKADRTYKQAFSCCSRTTCESSAQPVSANDEELARQLLSVPSNCFAEAIRSAYLKAVRAVHPDKGGSADDFRVLQHAYQLLMNCATDA